MHENTESVGTDSRKDNTETSTTAGADNNDEDKSEDTDKKTIIIAVLASLVSVATVVVVIVCLLFFCCANSPVYKGGFLARRRRGRTLPQEGEYDYVNENQIEVMKSQFTDNIPQNAVIPINEINITSHYDDCAEISANDSLTTTMEACAKQCQGPTVLFISAQDRKTSSTIQATCQTSTASSLHDVTRCGGGHLPGSKTLEAGVSHSDTTKECIYTLPNSGKHKLASPSSEGIYSVTSPAASPSLTEAANYHTLSSLTSEYAHLTRPGQENRIIDNIYNG